jgi:acetyl-CoA acetyltransferase
LEYTRFARVGDVSLQETPEVDDGGLLITDGVLTDNVEGVVRHVQAGQLMEQCEQLATILKRKSVEDDIV